MVEATIPVKAAPLPIKFPAVILPVVDTVFDPNAAMSVATLALPYVAGKPVS